MRMDIREFTPIREEESTFGIQVYYQSPIGVIYALRPVVEELTYWYTEKGEYIGYSLDGDNYISNG